MADKIVVALIGRKFRPPQNEEKMLDKRTRAFLVRAAGKNWYFVPSRKNGKSMVEIISHQAKSLSNTFK